MHGDVAYTTIGLESGAGLANQLAACKATLPSVSPNARGAQQKNKARVFLGYARAVGHRGSRGP